MFIAAWQLEFLLANIRIPRSYGMTIAARFLSCRIAATTSSHGRPTTTPWRGTPPVGSCRCYILFEWRFHSCALSSYIPSTRSNYIRLFKIVFRSNETTTPPSPFVTYKSFGVPKRDCIHDRPRRLQIDGTDPNRPDLQLPLADFFELPTGNFTLVVCCISRWI